LWILFLALLQMYKQVLTSDERDPVLFVGLLDAAVAADLP